MSASIYKASDYAECKCLKRTKMPPALIKPPCELTMSNRKEIEKWIREYYAASAFNKCEHQELPILSGEPMKILINDSKVKPLAVNTPARIPIAWEKKVMDDINHDVRL